MKKTVFHNRITSVTVVFTLAFCIGCGIFGIFKAVDLLSVSAGEIPEVSPTDSGAGEVSLSDIPGDAEDGAFTARREIRGMLYTYAFPPDQAVPFTYTHTVTTDSGKVKTTHRPSYLGGAEEGAIYNLYNEGGDYSVSGDYTQQNIIHYTTDQETVSGSLQNGEAVGIKIPAKSATGEPFCGSFQAVLSDDAALDWQSVKEQNTDAHYYDFHYAQDIAPLLGERTVSQYRINVPLNTDPVYAVTVTKETAATNVALHSFNEDSAWDSLYPATDHIASEAERVALAGEGWKETNLGVESLGFSGSGQSFTGYVSAGGRFYVSEVSSDRRIKSLTVTDAHGGSVPADVVSRHNGKYVITMPDYAISIKAESEALPIRKLTIVATSDDYSMNGVQQADSYQADSVYSSDATRLRFSNQGCTSPRTNGDKTRKGTGKKSVTCTDYYKYGDYVWWTSVLAFGHDGETTVSSNTSGTQFVEISNVRIYKEEKGELTEVSLSSVDYSTGVKNGRPYVRFRAQNYDMKVTFDVAEHADAYDNCCTIWLHETRPTTQDTVWCNYFNGVSNSKMYTRGSSEGNASVTDYVYVYNNAEPMKFSGTENTYRVGYFQKGKTYNYDIHFANQTMTHSTMIKSWKVYKADASGHSTGEEVQLGDGTKVISMKQYAEKDYLKARGTSATTNQSPFEYNKFKAPDYDIVIDLVKSGSRFLHWNTKADGSGTSYNAGDTFGINGSDVVLYAIWTKDSDTPSSPGTGESAMLILLALAAMGVSAAVAGGIITSHRRSRRQHEA